MVVVSIKLAVKMRVPKPKSRVVNSSRLSSLNGVKDVKLGRSSVEGRAMGNASNSGKGAESADMSGYTDVEERQKRYGFLY